MKAGSRPQYYRVRRMVQMVRESTDSGDLVNSADFMTEFGVSRRTVARDLDFLRDEERAPLEGDITIEPAWLSEHVGVLPEDRVRIDPDVWAQLAGFIERREVVDCGSVGAHKASEVNMKLPGGDRVRLVTVNGVKVTVRNHGWLELPVRAIM